MAFLIDFIAFSRDFNNDFNDDFDDFNEFLGDFNRNLNLNLTWTVNLPHLFLASKLASGRALRALPATPYDGH